MGIYLGAGSQYLWPRRRGSSDPFVGETWWVNPGASGSSENGSEANPYLSSMNAADAKANKTLTTPIRMFCDTTDSTPDTERLNLGALGQMVTSADNYLLFTAAPGNRAGASWDATKYHLYPAFASGAGAGAALAVPANSGSVASFVRVDGLQIGVSSQAGQDAACEIIYWSGGARLSNCLTRGTNSTDATHPTRGMSIIAGPWASNLWNNIFYAISAVGQNANAACIKNHGTTNLYSCTFILGGAGIICVDAGTNAEDVVTVKNCYAGGSTFEAYSGGGAGTLNLTTSAASDTTGTAGLDSIAINTTTFNNVTVDIENYHIPIGSALRGSGTNTSGDAAPLNFTTDIDGVTRTVPWTVGATAT